MEATGSRDADHGRAAYDAALDSELRRLARRLVQDAASADDVVQEAWVAALRENGIEHPASWMRSVTRRLASAERRTRERRQQAEVEAARPEANALVAPVELRELEASIERTLENVHGRIGEVLRLRYTEGLKLREIAERLDVPLGTIKSDHAQGLRSVRRRLTDEHGEARHWALGLIPFAAQRAPGDAATSAPFQLTWGVVIAGLVAALLGLVVVVGRTEGALPPLGATEVALEPERAAVGLHAGTPGVEPADRAEAPGRVEVAPDDVALPALQGADAPAADVALFEAADQELARISVRVMSQGAPVVGALVRALGAKQQASGDPRSVRPSSASMALLAQAETDAGGRVRLEVPRSRLRQPLTPGGEPTVILSAIDPTRAAPYSVAFEVRADDDREAVIAQDDPALNVLGVVVDDMGVPVKGAVVLVDPESYSPVPAGDGAWLLRRVERQVADVNGGFQLGRLALGARRISVQADGFLPTSLRLTFDTAGTQTLAEPIVLTRGAELVGRVLDAAGAPLAGASLWFEDDDYKVERSFARTDADGQFRMVGLPSGAQRLWAVGRVGGGHLSCSRELDLHAGERTELELTLASPGLGWLVVEREGEGPLARCRVRAQVVGDMRGFTELVATDEAGRVQLPRDPGKPVRIVVLPISGDSLAARMPLWSQVVDGPWTDDLRITVPATVTTNASMAGRLLDVDGGALTNPELLLLSLDHEFAIRLTLRSDGGFNASELAAGRYQLIGGRAGRQRWTLAEVQLQSGEAWSVRELRLPAEGVPALSASGGD
ncbi:MAG: sigma-70 family RNA polymerase sigma factor [Planctomycetota bacterium]